MYLIVLHKYYSSYCHHCLCTAHMTVITSMRCPLLAAVKLGVTNLTSLFGALYHGLRTAIRPIRFYGVSPCIWLKSSSFKVAMNTLACQSSSLMQCKASTFACLLNINFSSLRSLFNSRDTCERIIPLYIGCFGPPVCIYISRALRFAALSRIGTGTMVAVCMYFVFYMRALQHGKRLHDATMPAVLAWSPERPL